VLYPLVRPLLFRLDAERAHGLTLRALDAGHGFGLAALAAGRVPPAPVRVFGLDFPNPVGLAAGLDKNGAHIDALAALGFGFIEVGTVTPRPQPGNARPRLFRIPQAQAIINRMGFNNEGVEHLLRNVARARYRGILGINIGKNFDTPIERAVDDYLLCLRAVFGRASYVTVNISSPNTRDLRQLQQAQELDRLLGSLTTESRRLAQEHGRTVPLLVKIAPDLEPQELQDMAGLFVRHGIDGVIATNTTIARDAVTGLPDADQAGGLSGVPLRDRSTTVIRQLSQALAGRVPIVGVGGIFSPDDAREKLAAGASLVQVYSGLVYRGPGLPGRIIRALAQA
jgi:dihydroorotate dehydrogenase